MAKLFGALDLQMLTKEPFAAMMDTFEFCSLIVVPYFVLGDKKNVDPDEYQLALQILQGFFEQFCADLDARDLARLVKAMHGNFVPTAADHEPYTSVPWEFALLVLHVNLLRVFCKSTAAFSLVHVKYQYFLAKLSVHLGPNFVQFCTSLVPKNDNILHNIAMGRVRLCKFALYDNLEDRMVHFVSNPSDKLENEHSSLDKLDIVKATSNDSMDSLVIMLQIAEAASQVLPWEVLASIFSDEWLPLVTHSPQFVHIPKVTIGEIAFIEHPLSYFLLNILYRKKPRMTPFTNSLPTNFVIAIASQDKESYRSQIHVHDWIICNAWQYFAKCIKFGGNEWVEKRMVLSESFPWSVLYAIVRYAYFGEYPIFKVCYGKEMVLCPQSKSTNFVIIDREPLIPQVQWTAFFDSEFEQYVSTEVPEDGLSNLIVE